ncbi:MAG: sulfate ABC transporter permease subunit CysT [Acidobacteriota bacterium]
MTVDRRGDSPPPTPGFRPEPASTAVRLGLRTVAGGYLLLLVALPLVAVVYVSLQAGPGQFWRDITHPLAREALRLTLLLSVLAAAVNTVMGTLTAWVLVRCSFPGRSLLNALIDLPFAMPTLVTGLMLVALYGPQSWLGAWLEGVGLSVVFARPGILLALLVVTYPFVVRTVQPALEQLDPRQEEAALTLGADRPAAFRHVILPEILPGVVSGALLTFSRCIGEFGSVVVVAGNIPGRTLTAPVYIYAQIESDLPRSAAAVSVVLLSTSLLLLFVGEYLSRGARAGGGRE